jgi:hypothetical protein
MFLKDVLKQAAFATAELPPKNTIRYTEEFVNALPAKDIFANKRGDQYEYVQIAPYDVDALWSAVSNGNNTLLTFFSTINEWDEEMYVRDFTTLMTAPVRHYVVAIANSTHVKDGQEWVSVIDSSPNKGFALRHIRKDFLKSRMYLGGGFYYPVTKKKGKVISLPLKRLEFGNRGYEVRILQQFLTQEGLLSSIHQTGYYGNLTAAAVLKWQLKNLLESERNNLTALEGKFWGPKSIEFIVNKYAS